MARQTQPTDGGVIDSEQYPVVPLSAGFHNRREGPVHRLATPAQFFIQTIRRRNKNGKERIVQATIQADRL